MIDRVAKSKTRARCEIIVVIVIADCYSSRVFVVKVTITKNG